MDFLLNLPTYSSRYHAHNHPPIVHDSLEQNWQLSAIAWPRQLSLKLE